MKLTKNKKIIIASLLLIVPTIIIGFIFFLLIDNSQEEIKNTESLDSTLMRLDDIEENFNLDSISPELDTTSTGITLSQNTTLNNKQEISEYDMAINRNLDEFIREIENLENVDEQTKLKVINNLKYIQNYKLEDDQTVNYFNDLANGFSNPSKDLAFEDISKDSIENYLEDIAVQVSNLNPPQELQDYNSLIVSDIRNAKQVIVSIYEQYDLESFLNIDFDNLTTEELLILEEKAKELENLPDNELNFEFQSENYDIESAVSKTSYGEYLQVVSETKTLILELRSQM